MNKNKLILISTFLLLISTIIISGCAEQVSKVQTSKSNEVDVITPQQAYCDNLAKNLDAQIIDTQNPPGRFIISALGENIGEVGGVLVNIKNNGLDRNYNSYTLTFVVSANDSSSAKGELYLLTTSNETLPYNIGTFYTFDLRNINLYSAATSGMFIDNELNKLKQVDCWPME